MRSHADGSVIIQTSSKSVPSPPSWFGARLPDGGAPSQAWCRDQNE
jgi:hypothetical protein